MYYVSPCFSFRVVSLTPGRTLGKIVSQTILWTARWPQGPVLMKTVSWSYSPAGVRRPLCSRCLNQFDFFSLNLKWKGLLQLSSDLKSKMQWTCQRTAVRTIMPCIYGWWIYRWHNWGFISLFGFLRGPSWPGLVPSKVLSVLYILLSARLYALVATFDAQCM